MNPKDILLPQVVPDYSNVSTQKDGGPAFPHVDSFGAVEYGMSLRDYFAAAALQGWLASYGHDTPHPCTVDKGETTALLSYKMADAMLAERAKGGAL